MYGLRVDRLKVFENIGTYFMIVIVIFGELRWPICSICFPLQINISVS